MKIATGLSLPSIARVGTDNLDVELIETTMDKLVTTGSGKFKYIINLIRE